MTKKGTNLVFLISQPRAGSTMTQRILGAHSLIHTQSEPWVLLFPLHAHKPDNLVTKYDSFLYSKALNNFIKTIPGEYDFYRDNIAKAYLNLYNKYLQHLPLPFLSPHLSFSTF